MAGGDHSKQVITLQQFHNSDASSKIILALTLATAVISMTGLIGTSFAQNSQNGSNGSPRDCTTFYYGKGPC